MVDQELSDGDIIESEVPFSKRKKTDGIIVEESSSNGSHPNYGGGELIEGPWNYSVLPSVIPLYLLPKELLPSITNITTPVHNSIGSNKQNEITTNNNILTHRSSGQTSGNTNRFQIHQEPNEIQRKSYKNENRCLLPNPLVICLKDRNGENRGRLPRIVEGNVSVKLVSSEGTDLPGNLDQQLQCNDGALVRPLDEHLSAAFSLKLLCTSEGNHFRLLFYITYTTEDSIKYEERLLSLPFIVYSNRKKNILKENAPLVIDLKPISGPSNADTEIWIKGKGFTEYGKLIMLFNIFVNFFFFF